MPAAGDVGRCGDSDGMASQEKEIGFVRVDKGFHHKCLRGLRLCEYMLIYGCKYPLFKDFGAVLGT